MLKKTKQILAALLAFIMFVCVFATTAKAADVTQAEWEEALSHYNVNGGLYRDENWNVHWQTMDGLAHPTVITRYTTIGFTITPLDSSGNVIDRNNIIYIDKATASGSSITYGGYELSTFTFSAAIMDAEIQKLGMDVYNRYKAGEPVIRVDHVQAVRHNDVLSAIMAGGKPVPNPAYSGPMQGDINGDGALNLLWDEEYQGMLGIFGMGIDPSMRTQWNLLLHLEIQSGDGGDGGDEPFGNLPPEEVVTTTSTVQGWGYSDTPGGEAALNNVTWHTSDVYDLGKGIPSGESLDNHVCVNQFAPRLIYGIVNGKRQYHVAVKIQGENPDGTTWETDVHPFAVTRTYRYYYLNDLSVYGIKEAKIDQDSYNGVIYNTFASVPVMALNNGLTMKTKFGTNNRDAHVINEPSLVNPTQILQANGEYATGASITINVGVRQYESVIDNSSGSEVIINPTEFKADVEKAVGEYKVKNDRLQINGIVYMNDVLSNTNAPEPRAFNYGQDAVYLTDEKTVKIPENKHNDSYTTTATYTYRNLLSGVATDTFERTARGVNAIHKDYRHNEPIVVHTPVISPVKILDVNSNDVSKTQLTNPGTAGGEKYFLTLDTKYTFKFDITRWMQRATGLTAAELERFLPGYGDGTEQGFYDKWVKEKYVSFPFSVAINDVFYEADDHEVNGIGYTEWIPLGKYADEAEFYITPWATESTTLFNDPNKYSVIQYCVEAINELDDLGLDHHNVNNPNHGAEEDTMNSTWNDPTTPGDESSYVATYQIPVDVSGIIYDFMIVGSTNADIYRIGGTDPRYSFAENKEEKRAGVLNRIGGPDVRFALDGTFPTNEAGDRIAWDPYNTIAMSKGTSKAFSDMGAVWQGQYINFSVKTIANLSEEDDEIQLMPIFRYYEEDGTEYTNDEIQVYYMSDSTTDFIRMGSAKDLENLKTTRLGESQFNGAYYNGSPESHGNDDLGYSSDYYFADKTTAARTYYLRHDVESYTMGRVVLKDTLRLLTGNLELLRDNLANPIDALETMEDLYGDTAGVNDLEEKLHNSMQTWFGKYYIPDKMFILKTSDLDGIGDINGDGIIDLEDYVIENGKISESSSLWAKGGYVAVNVDIRSINDGKDHLSYGVNDGDKTRRTQDMWTIEGKRENVFTGGSANLKINAHSGDIAIIEVGKKVSDKYSGKILFID